MKALIVGAAWARGSSDFYAELASSHDLVIAADAAAERLVALRVKPDLAVGDFDSALPGAAERLEAAGVTVRVWAPEKDVTDLEIAAQAARDAGATSVTITGAFRDRLDHTLAALGTLARLVDLDATAVEPELTVWACDGDLRPTLALTLAPGSLLSVVAVAGPATGVTLQGLRYPLEGARLEPLEGLGVSNVAVDAVQGVAVASGTLLVLAPR